MLGEGPDSFDRFGVLHEARLAHEQHVSEAADPFVELLDLSPNGGRAPSERDALIDHLQETHRRDVVRGALATQGRGAQVVRQIARGHSELERYFVRLEIPHQFTGPFESFGVGLPRVDERRVAEAIICGRGLSGLGDPVTVSLVYLASALIACEEGGYNEAVVGDPGSTPRA